MGADAVISFARAQIGKPYKFGAVGPNSYDCSGLVVAAFKAGANKTLPHFTGSLVLLGSPVSQSALQPGDLVFPDSHHVQIYSGNGNIIEAPRTGLNVREVKMWGFWKARRLITPGTGSAGSTSGQIVTVGNPLIPDSVEKAAAFIGDPAVWRKAGTYFIGALLILIGLVILYYTQIAGTTTRVAGKVIKQVASNGKP